MISILKHVMQLIIGAIVLMLVSCSDKPDVLAEAKNQLNTAEYLSYTATAYFPIPDSKLVDTSVSRLQVAFNSEYPNGFKFINSSDQSDMVFTDNQLISVSHADAVSRIYLPKHFKDMDQFYSTVKRNAFSRWSPLTFMQNEYRFKTDTIINSKTVKNYVEVVTDTIIEGNKVLTEHHIFIDDQANVTRFERRNYNDGQLSQKIRIDFSDFNYSQNPVEMYYKTPNGYVTAYGQSKRVVPKKVGELAPQFTGVTMAGDSISLSDYKGQKVLLNFSVVNCGYCKKTLDYMNRDDYVLSNDIPMLYINPEDDDQRMEVYRDDIEITVPVITDAQDIGTSYGINSYPRFVLVNEAGIIEEVQFGFSEEFLDEFKKASE